MKDVGSSEAILACRIIDRPLRPLFPHTLRNRRHSLIRVFVLNDDSIFNAG